MSDNPSIVIVTQYCTVDWWYIKLDSNRLVPRRKDMPDWTTCPGSLYGDYQTSEEAAEVARWWGFEPIIRTHEEEHQHGPIQRSQSPAERLGEVLAKPDEQRRRSWIPQWR